MNTVNISDCGTYDELINTMRNAGDLATGFGNIGAFEDTKLRSLLGNPPNFGNYTNVYAKTIFNDTAVGCIHLVANGLYCHGICIGYICWDNTGGRYFSGWLH